MAHGPADVVGALGKLELELCTAMALGSSGAFRSEVLSGRAVLDLEFSHQSGWMRLTAGDILLSRKKFGGVGDGRPQRYVDVLDEAAVSSPTAIAAQIEALSDARRVVRGLLFAEKCDFDVVTRWLPMIEPLVYAVGTRIVVALDHARKRVIDACVTRQPEADSLVLEYGRSVEALRRSMLVATDAGADWLKGMAESFAWSRWTPSFSLSRERDLRSVEIAVRAASRFGPSVVDRYFDALRRATHPLYALDAIAGLTAIGFRYAEERKALVRSLESELAGLPEKRIATPEMVAAGFGEALRLLTVGSSDIAQSRHRRGDAFNLDAAGRMPVFSVIAQAVHSPIRDYAVGAKTARRPSTRRERETFLRTWVPYPDLATLPDSSFGRA